MMRTQYGYRKDCLMKGYVTKLRDIDSIEIPAEMLTVNLDAERIEAEISALSLRYASEADAPSCAEGDIVRCRADEASYPDKRAILLFTGTPLPAAEAAAKAAVGKKVGESFKTEFAGKPAELTVLKIIRRTPVEVNDALIASIGLDGVSTVDDYRAMLTVKATDDANLENSKAVMRYLMDEMINGSEFAYDEAEMRESIEKAKAEYAAVPDDEGFAPTDEEVAMSVVYRHKQSWAAEAFCKARGIEPDEDEIKQQAEQIGQMMELMGESVPDEAELLDMARSEVCLDPLFEHLNRIIMQKIGG